MDLDYYFNVDHVRKKEGKLLRVYIYTDASKAAASRALLGLLAYIGLKEPKMDGGGATFV
jgi:hypothetical protein